MSRQKAKNERQVIHSERSTDSGLSDNSGTKGRATVEAELKRLSDVLETLPAMACLLTSDHHVALANRAFRERFGEADGRHCYEFCFNKEEPCDFCESYKVLQTGQPHRWQVTGPDGSIIDAYDLPFTDADGTPMILEMDIDVTEAKRKEEALYRTNLDLEQKVEERTRDLKESENKYRRLFEDLSDQQSFLKTVLNHSRVGISVMKGEELRYTLVNDAYQAIAPGVQISGRTYREVFPEGVRSGAEEKILDVLRTGEAWKIDRHKAPIPGEPDATWEGVVLRLPLKEGEEPSVLGLTWDVTEESKQAEALKESEERFHTLADNVPQLEWIADETGFIFWYNKQWYEYTGTTSEQMEGWGWQSVHDPEVLPAVLEQWKVSIATGQPFEMVFPLRGADGVFRPFLTRVLPVKDATGKVIRWFGTNTDITKELEMRRSLERSNAELQQFAYVASHDLQEPLRMVTAYLGLLEKKYADSLDGDAKKYMEFAIEGGLRARDLVRDLLEVSRLDSQAEPMSRTNMNEVMQNVTSVLAFQIGEEHATVVADSLPEIIAVKAQMVLLLQNLVGNAIKFHGDQSPEVHISCENRRDSWLFSVSDNGIGIESQYKDKIFVIFQRLHTREEYEGTGIGLAISKKIVERHGGRIWFDSQIGHGTTFYFTIPKEPGKWT